MFIALLSAVVHAAPPELIQLREDVRALAKSKNCVNCHLPGQRGALQRILDVYNLRDTHWSAALDNIRLGRFQDRPALSAGHAEHGHGGFLVGFGSRYPSK